MKNICRYRGVILLSVVAALLACGCAKQPPAAERVPAPAATDQDPKQIILAMVNGAKISQEAVDEAMARMKASRHSVPASSQEEARKRALGQLIIQELVVQDAARQGVRVDEKDLNDAMRTFTANRGHAEGYEAYLKARNLTNEQARSQVERSLLLQLMYAREVRAKVAVARDEVKKEYELHKDKYIAPAKVSLIDITISQRQGVQTMLKKAEEILAALNADKDRDPMKLPADDIVTVNSRDIESGKDPLLFDAARNLQEGELSGLLETPEGPHIIKLIRYTPQRQMSFEEAEGRIEGMLKVVAEMKRFSEWSDGLKKDAKIEMLDVMRQQDKKTP